MNIILMTIFVSLFFIIISYSTFYFVVNMIVSPAEVAGGSTVFDETWGSATPGTYTAEPITGSDESGWDLDDVTAGGVVVPNPADDYVTLSGNGDDWYLKISDCGCDSTNNEIIIGFEVPSTNGGYIDFRLYNASADERVFTIEMNDEDDLYINGTSIDSGAGADTRFEIKITINYGANTFDYDVNSGTVTATGVAWGDSTGSGGDMQRFEGYISNNANNLKKLGRFRVGDGIIT